MDRKSRKPAHPALGADRLSRSKKSERADRVGASGSTEQQRAGRRDGHSASSWRDRTTRAFICEGPLHAGPGEANAAHARETRSFGNANAGGGVGHPAQLRSGRALAAAFGVGTSDLGHQPLEAHFPRFAPCEMGPAPETAAEIARPSPCN